MRHNTMITSAGTNIRQLPAIYKLVRWTAGTRNADIGGGKYDELTKALKEVGVQNVVYDTYNRSREHNETAIALISGGQCHTATVCNVLNAISEPEARLHVIRQAADCLVPTGTAYFLIHEGDGSGEGRKTSSGWQENRPAESYMPEIKKAFQIVLRRGHLIVAKLPICANSGWRRRRILFR